MLIDDMRAEWAELDTRVDALDREFVACARSSAPARRLATIPGIGALNATAMVAAVGEAEGFARGRDLAAWLGLVPRQMTTGGKARLGGITKRGRQLPARDADPRRTGGASQPQPQRHAARGLGCAA